MMIKLVGTAIWICLITLASVYFSMQAQSTTPDAPAPSEFFGGLDYIRGDVISVPVISEGKVHGYFLARLVFTAEPEKLRTLSVDPQSLITDELYSHLFGNAEIDFTRLDTFDLPAFREGIRDALNERVGEKIFHEIIIEQVDYLTKEEIRSNLQRNRPMTVDEAIAEGAEETAGEDTGAEQ